MNLMNSHIYLAPKNRAPDSSHQNALNHTANICRFLSHAIKQIFLDVQTSAFDAIMLKTRQMRLKGLWKEYENECYCWLTLLITSKAVNALLAHYAETLKSYEVAQSYIQNLIGSPNDSKIVENDYEYVKIRILFNKMTSQQRAHDRFSLRQIHNVLRNTLDRLETFLPKQNLSQYVKLSYIEGLLDETSLNGWKRTCIGRASYGSLMEYIEYRCDSLCQPPTRAPKCKLCANKRHWPFKCDIFRLLAMPERINYVRRNSLCINCFSETHRSDECVLPPCPRCSTPQSKLHHNSALCPGNSFIVDAAAATSFEHFVLKNYNIID